MSARQWLGGLAFVEIALIIVALRTGWRWHRTPGVVRAARALRRWWRRVLLGALAGWTIANVLGVALIIGVFEISSPGETTISESVAVALPIAGVGLGALVGYGTRKEKGDAATT